MLAAGAPRQQDPAAAGGLAREADQRQDLPPPGRPAPADLESHGPGPKRPFGLTWVVFYWVFVGASCIIGGSLLTVMTGVLAGAVEGSGGLFGDLKQAQRQSATILVFMEFGGLLTFHYGLLTLVACYGLWTFRKWGIVLGRAMAIAGVVFSVIGVIASVASHAGIFASVVGLAISSVILAYLFAGPPGFYTRLRQYLRANRLREDMWQGYE